MLTADVRLKLLELTRLGRAFSLDELAQEVQIGTISLMETVQQLCGGGLATFGKMKFQLDTRQRIVLAEELVHFGRDPYTVSRLLEWQEFENFAMSSLKENGFHASKHLVFRSKAGRREIDIVAWNDMLLLAIDCKHWMRQLTPSRIRSAVLAQVERAAALAEKPELLFRIGVAGVERRKIMPVLFSLAEPRQGIVDGVPIVSISKLISFLYGISHVDERFCNFPVKSLGMPSIAESGPKG